jgi:hypothetical protein
VFQVRHLDSSTVAKYEKAADTTYSKAQTDGKTPGKLLRLFALYENLTRFIMPLSSECTDREHAETPITLSTNIVDISGVSLRQFWNLKGHMQAASQLATAHYPETLDRMSPRWLCQIEFQGKKANGCDRYIRHRRARFLLDGVGMGQAVV